jgi:hypothetical protein
VKLRAAAPRLGGVIIAACLLLACDRKSPRVAASAASGVKSFGSTWIDTTTPVLDGGAYAQGLTGGIWYLRDTLAIPVQAVGGPAVQSRFRASLPFDEITPVIGGGAYAHGTEGAWLLRGGMAFPIREVSNMPVDSAKPGLTDAAWLFGRSVRDPDEPARQQEDVDPDYEQEEPDPP